MKSPAVEQAALQQITIAAAALGAAKMGHDEHDVADAQERLRSIVDTANDVGVSWQSVADALGLRRGNAYQRFRRRPQPSDATASDAAVVPESVLGAAGSLRALNGVPTFLALQEICLKYVVEHRFTRNVGARPTCTCRIEVATWDGWLDHVTELQASHISMAIQEARSGGQSAV